MARSRNIKPGFYKNDELAECSIWARFIFPGLWMLADRKGRLEDRPKKIKGELLPFDAQEIEPLLRELNDRRFILRYEIDGALYIQILNFMKHQAPHYSEIESVIKAPLLPESVPHEESKTPESMPDEEPKHPENSVNGAALRGGRNPLIPDSGFLIPDSLIPPATAGVPTAPAEPTARKKPKARSARPKGSAAWDAYAFAYRNRYGAEPVRNASVNAQMARLVGRLGVEDAPHVAAFYVDHNKAYYVSKAHPVSVLLADCEGLRTQWATGRKVMAKDGQEADRIASDGGMWGRVRDKLAAKEVIGG